MSPRIERLDAYAFAAVVVAGLAPVADAVFIARQAGVSAEDGLSEIAGALVRMGEDIEQIRSACAMLGSGDGHGGANFKPGQMTSFRGESASAVHGVRIDVSASLQVALDACGGLFLETGIWPPRQHTPFALELWGALRSGFTCAAHGMRQLVEAVGELSGGLPRP